MCERYRILLRRRAGQTAPYTDDPILRKYRFCNVFREDDKTTVWFRENVRGPMADEPGVLLATIIFRWFNRITTAEVMHAHRLFTDWNPSRARAVLKDLHPLITGAYVIRTPTGMSKLDGLIALITPIWQAREQWQQTIAGCGSLEQACYQLQQLDGLGSFMAYEVVTDLRHTRYLRNASDIHSWANPGPGAARGLGHVLFSDPEEFRYDAAVDTERLQAGMRHLLALSLDSHYWPKTFPAWEMREVEHSLCEYAKYRGAQAGRKLKQRFS